MATISGERVSGSPATTLSIEFRSIHNLVRAASRSVRRRSSSKIHLGAAGNLPLLIRRPRKSLRSCRPTGDTLAALPPGRPRRASRTVTRGAGDSGGAQRLHRIDPALIEGVKRASGLAGKSQRLAECDVGLVGAFACEPRGDDLAVDHGLPGFAPGPTLVRQRELGRLVSPSDQQQRIGNRAMEPTPPVVLRARSREARASGQLSRDIRDRRRVFGDTDRRRL